MKHMLIQIFSVSILPFALSSAEMDSSKDLPKRIDRNSLEFIPFTANTAPDSKKVCHEPTGCSDFTIEYPQTGKRSKTVKAADFGFSEKSENCAGAINRAIEYCRENGATRLELAPGTYKCFDAEGITLNGIKDLSFDGKGANLVFRRKNLRPKDEPEDPNFSITNCVRVKLCDFNSDWDWATDPLGALVKVTDTHTDKKGDSYIDVEFVGYEKYPLYEKPMPIKVMTLMNEAMDGFSDERGSVYFGTGSGHYGTKNGWLSPNKARIYPGVKPVGLPRPEDYPSQYSKKKNYWVSARALVGRTYRIMHYYYGKNAFSLIDSRDISFENINVFSCRGMGFRIHENTSHWQAVNVNFSPPPSAFPKRPCTTTADVIHCSSNGGFCKLINFRATLNQDDIFNFHDKGAYVKSTGSNTLNLINMGGAGYIHAEAGDEVELFNPDYTPTDFKAKISCVKGNRVELDRPHPGAEEYILQKSAFRTRNILLKGCVYRNYAGRGIMQTSDVTIENCRFENGIRIPLRLQRAFSMGQWAEGYGCRNVIVRNCDFISSMCTQPLYGITHDIFAGSRRVDDASDFDKGATASDILIENCRFKNVVGMVFYTNYAKNITFRRNFLTVSDVSSIKSYAGCAFFENSESIVFEDNIIVTRSDSSPGAFVAEKCKDVRIAGNRLFTSATGSR